MPYRVLAITPIPMEEEGLKNRRAQIPKELIRDGYEVEFKSVKGGTLDGGSYYDAMLMDMFVFEAGLDAEKDGYDAVIIDTTSDSGMYALRSRLNIPVFGAGQMAYHFACTLGDKFSVINMWDRWLQLVHESLTEYGLWPKCASVRCPENITPDTVGLYEGKDFVFKELERVSRQCIDEDGAHVIVIGSTTMHQAHEYLAKVLPVPVVNPGLIMWKMCEFYLEIGLKHSKHAFPSPLGGTLDDDIHAQLARVVGLD